MSGADSGTAATAKRLTEKEWAEISAIWELGGTRGRDIAKQYGVTPESISRGLKKRGVVYGKHAAAAARKVIEAGTDDAELSVRRAKETKEEHYKIASYLARLAAKKVQDAEKGTITYSRADEELRAIMASMKVNQVARAERWAILGLDRDDAFDADEMPELTIREMTPDEIQATKIRQEAALREIGVITDDVEGQEPDLSDLTDQDDDG